jgi:hypothetical protein
VCLPVRIDRIEFFGAPRRAAFGQFDVLQRDADDLIGTVQAVDATGHTIEQMRGYVVHVLERRGDSPGLDAPAERSLEDEQQLASAVGRWFDASRAAALSIALEHVAGLGALSREKRHERERQIIKRAVNGALASIGTDGPDGVLIDWLESGRPIVRGADGCNVSLTHDLDTCVVVAGPGRQGCDLASINRRARGDWLGLLGEIRGAILDVLLAGGESLDTAATRIWTAAEAARKATDTAALDLAVHERRDGSVLFRCAASGQEFHVLTTAVRVQGRDRIWAVVVQPADPA